MSVTTIKNNETAILVTGATGTVGSEVVKQATSLHNHRFLQVSELKLLFIQKITDNLT